MGKSPFGKARGSALIRVLAGLLATLPVSALPDGGTDFPWRQAAEHDMQAP
jgi:hypothetical protein